MEDKLTLMHGDCLQRLKELPDCSVDAVVTDPPYGLSFMGKKWDYDVPSVEVWAECLRVLKPGGHLLAFAGTRTQHRMAVRIEDAGFEIRDMIAWVYSTGFPKSMNLDRLRGDNICGCAEPYAQNGTKEIPEHDVRPVRNSYLQAAELAGEELGQVLQPGLQEQGAPTHRQTDGARQHAWPVQPRMEGRSDAPQAAGQLRAGSLHAGAGVGQADGASGRVRDGAPAGDGAVVRLPADADRGGAPCGPQPTTQREAEPRTVAGQPEPQTLGAWPFCGGCGLPVVPRGLGTALKPALEPVTVARKPLSGTVAENVLAHGTGALNIDGCRVEMNGEAVRTTQGGKAGGGFDVGSGDGTRAGAYESHAAGRWPANLIHDGSEGVLAGFPSDGKVRGGNAWRWQDSPQEPFSSSTGSAARFFYAAKASKRDRGEGNGHPTVKPTDLMRYLCRLVTPPGGLVLDPFMGSGSTGKAAMLEGFRFIGIEREAEYLEIARARIAAACEVKTPQSPINDLFSDLT